MKPRLGAWHRLVIVLGVAFFLMPLVVTGAFSLWEGGDRYGFAAYRELVGDPALWSSLLLSLQLAGETMLLGLVLLVPAMIFVHLKAPWLKPLFEFASALPFVVPAIALVAGLTTLYTGPVWLIGTANYLVVPYFFLALPYAYRAIDVGMTNLDMHTLTEAGQSLGASWAQIFRHVLLPNLSTALIGATLLTLTIVMGEFTFASVLLFKTFAVYINDTGSSKVTEAAALSLVSFLITWAAMLGVLLTGRGNAQIGGAR
ncbi:MAG: ABC transporter permease subunit [Rhodospirillales bacterium]|nr:ABC transporter permease subunit [Rhodospirillales bacterium]MDE2198785.1 ABC transporter permease subunit [Rhodospirillales bacterium]MDE2575012.1 ABC transporter permease subunit [Rhodospirillales bacterium]